MTEELITEQAQADWYQDPLGRHQYRYWDGTAWTENVSDDGAQSIDPIVAATAVEPVFGAGLAQHEHPRCNVCGYVGPLKKPPLIYKRDIVISLVLLVLFGVGLIWFTISALQKKPMSCPNCGSRDSFTYIY